MSELYHRLLLWHKLVAMVTGGLALCSARHKLNRDEARGWIENLRNVALEIESVVEGRGFVLDDRGNLINASQHTEAPRSQSTMGEGKPRKKEGSRKAVARKQ